MTLGSGATDLLIEWEDMFPYWGPIANISAKWVTMNVTITMTMTIIMTKTVATKDISHFFCSRNSYTKAEVSSLLQVPVENFNPFHMLLIHRLRRKTTWEWFPLFRSVLFTLQEIFNNLSTLDMRLVLLQSISPQTFGHLEFVLKLAEFSHLREDAPYPQVQCHPFQANLTFFSKTLSTV